MKGVLLGPQQLKQTLGEAVRFIDREGPVAVVTAGWQEREDQDEELAAQLGRPIINLKLHARGEQVFSADREFAKAHRARQDQLRQIQEFYRLRLERCIDAALDIERRVQNSVMEVDEREVSLDVIRQIDAEHLARVTALREAHEAHLRTLERPHITRHRLELEKLLSDVQIIAIAGGHVAVLLNRLRMFELPQLITRQSLIAWSGGAMVTSERLVLFHESPPEGAGVSEVLEQGLGWHRGVLPLPNPKLRLRLDDTFRVGWMSRRYNHSKCVAFDHGDFVCFDEDRWFNASGTVLLEADGTVHKGWAS